jgi:small subunit ribosomal protein S1
VKVVRAPKPRRGAIVTGKVNRVEPFGIFIEFDGLTGMIPASETGTERGTDLKRTFAMGKELKAEVIEINGDKLKLSITQAQRTEERADLNAWKAEQAKKVTSAGGFNSLADKLKGLTLK